MQERAKHLNGELVVLPREEQGTQVKLTFLPVGGKDLYQ